MALRPSDDAAPATAALAPRRLGGYALGALGAAALAVGLGVLPAEFGVDPTGFGRLTGLSRLYAPPEPASVVLETTLSAPVEVASQPATPFREDRVTVEVGALQQNYGQIEYKLSALAGDDFVYEWTASAPLYFEFHGHTEPDADGEITVMDYARGTATSGQGRLTAPLTGIHGWYFRNDLFEPVTVEFRLAGFYELGPGILIPGVVEAPELATPQDTEAAEDALRQALPE